MKKFLLHSFIAMFTMLVVAGCGGGSDGGNDADTTKPVITVEAITVDMGATTYLVPKGTTSKVSKINGIDENLLIAGKKEEVGAFIHTIGTSTTIPKSSKLLSAKRMQKGVETVLSTLQNDATTLNSISLLTTQNFQTPYAFTLASYELRTITDEQPLNLAGKIISIINGGAGTSGISIADPSAPFATEFIFLLLYGDYQGSTFYIAAVVPKSQYAQYATIVSMITNAARVAPTGTSLQSSAENYNVTAGSGNADFLFVVDDSGSMSDDQDALSKAAEQFTAKMSTSGVAYRSAIITTGSGADGGYGTAYSILNRTGIIENNDTMLEQELVVGTGGSGTETGIWNAEQALQSQANRDSTDGAVTALGMPKIGASLSVIIISDEDSQYSYRAGMDFNVSANLFIDRNIRVYSIIKPYYSYSSTGIFDEYNRSQYDDLSLVTGGIYSDIRNTDANGTLDYSTIMTKIAQDAGGASSSYILAHPAAVINKVTVDGTEVLQDTTNGYIYVQSSSAILFNGTTVPTSGQTVVVEYEYYQ